MSKKKPFPRPPFLLGLLLVAPLLLALTACIFLGSAEYGVILLFLVATQVLASLVALTKRPVTSFLLMGIGIAIGIVEGCVVLSMRRDPCAGLSGYAATKCVSTDVEGLGLGLMSMTPPVVPVPIVVIGNLVRFLHRAICAWRQSALRHPR